MSDLFLSLEVDEALAVRRPIVALETTFVTHGLPLSKSLDIASSVQAEIRSGGAVPASIGLLEGQLRVGLSCSELERLAGTPGVAKLNLSNLAAQAAKRGSGSTTVAATMSVASRAGIQVLCTGGIGGVHRGAALTGDVSADLTALGRFPVAVVCAGAKAVLDLPRTVQALETLGVPVYGFASERFPAFYRRDSGLAVDRRFDAVEDLAAAVSAHFRLGLGTGIVVANPIPPEHEMPLDLYEESLAAALADASARNVLGREVTPFLLDRLRELTDGRSVFSNHALLLANARVAAALAVALAA